MAACTHRIESLCRGDIERARGTAESLGRAGARRLARCNENRRAHSHGNRAHIFDKHRGVGGRKTRDEGIGQIDYGDARRARQRERGREARALRGTKPVYLLLRGRSKTKRGEKRESIGRARPCAKGALLGVALSRRIGSGLAFWAAHGSMLRNARREIRGIART